MEKSFTKNDRKVQSKKLKNFSQEDGYDRTPFAVAIAAALVIDFGASPSAVKRGRTFNVRQRTGCAELVRGQEQPEW